MDDPIDDENALVKLTSLVVVGLGLSALFLGFEWFWVVFAVGFAVVVPIVKLLSDALDIDLGSGERDRRPNRTENPTARDRTADQSSRASDSESKQDALDALRSRYARGDLTEEEFERKVEALLATETPESARKHVERETETSTDR